MHFRSSFQFYADNRDCACSAGAVTFQDVCHPMFVNGSDQLVSAGAVKL